MFWVDPRVDTILSQQIRRDLRVAEMFESSDVNGCEHVRETITPPTRVQKLHSSSSKLHAINSRKARY
jgi:hypothetical protein